jgi:hypothetical protein
MAQIFHPSTNTLSKASLFGGVFFVGAALWGLNAVNRSDWVSEANVAVEQPVPFSHEHHVSGLGIDCRYCHTSVEEAAFAGIPSTEVCMTCHSQIWIDSEMLAPVRASYRENRPMSWVRVHDLPDFVYFDHSVHVAAGVGCTSCHGRVDQMPLVWQANPLQMHWCLACHRDPTPSLRPREEVFDVLWEPPAPVPQARPGAFAGLTDCSVCHR